MYNRARNNWNQQFINKCGTGNQEHPFKKMWKEKMFHSLSVPPANVLELDDKYELHLNAPGFEKEDFKLAIVENSIMVSASDKKQATESWKRQEFEIRGFERKFELNDKIDKATVAATYKNGVLIVTLPKLEGQETIRQEIKIA